MIEMIENKNVENSVENVDNTTVFDNAVPMDRIKYINNIKDLKESIRNWDVISVDVIESNLTYDEQMLLVYLMSDADYNLSLFVSVYDTFLSLFKKYTQCFGYAFVFDLRIPCCPPIEYNTISYYDKSLIGKLGYTGVPVHIEASYRLFNSVVSRLAENEFKLNSLIEIDNDSKNNDLKKNYGIDLSKYYSDMCERYSVSDEIDISGVLKILRSLTGLTQSAFAKRYHINYGTYVQWEQGNRKPPEHDIYMLNRLVRYDVTYAKIGTVYDCIEELSYEYGNILECPVIVVHNDGKSFECTVLNLIDSDSDRDALVDKYEFEKKGYTSVLKIYLQE